MKKNTAKYEATIQLLNNMLVCTETQLISVPELLLTLETQFGATLRYRKQWLLEWVQKNRAQVMPIRTTTAWSQGNKVAWEKWHIKDDHSWISHLRILPKKTQTPDRGLTDDELMHALSFASYLIFTNGMCPICGAQVYPCDNFTQKVDLELGIQHYKQPEHPERWKEATENLKAMGMM